jgi:mannose-1-phosphate guanylyltransferase/mannose-6-phosphate isomerase-like protein (cupin superfamily)
LIDYTQVHAIILAGGSGVRFWPLSRETYPKQMLQIAGEDTLIRQTIKRISGFVPSQNIWIVTTADKAQDIKFHLNPLGPLAEGIRFINEPLGRNTAPAIGLSALCLHHLSPDSVMIVMPSDHAIPDEERFLEDLRRAILGALDGHLVTFGIKPIRPETGYGYIKADIVPGTEVGGLFRIDRFVEKPDIETAKIYLSEGSYFWNSGIFVWKTSRILAEIEAHLPFLYKSLKEMEPVLFTPEQPGKARKAHSAKRIAQDGLTETQLPETGSSKEKQPDKLKEIYSRLESISVDYGILERSSDILMVPATFTWSDLGSWAALDEIIPRNSDGNILKGNTIDVGSRDSIVFAGERLVTTIGLKEMVVVDTPDALLVAPKTRSQDVRKVVDVLKQTGREEHLLHKTVERPWGSYTVLEKGHGYKLKRIFLRPKARLSLQRHKKRSEHWVVVAGVARVTRGDEIYLVQTNESTYIPLSTKHRLENPGDGSLQVIEVQSGDYLEEDDIERFDDDYGRL